MLREGFYRRVSRRGAKAQREDKGKREMKKIFFAVFILSFLNNIHAIDDKIWGFWLSEKNMRGTKLELEREFEYHLEKIKDIRNNAYFRNQQDFLETHTVLGTMLYPGNGGIFILTNIEEITSYEYILYMTTVIGYIGETKEYGDGTVKMFFFNEDAVYFEALSDDENGTYSHFFQGPEKVKYRATVTDSYYPERAGIPNYSKRMLDYSPPVTNTQEEVKQPELTNLSVDTENQQSDQNSAKTSAIPLWALFAIIGGVVVVAGGVVFVMMRSRK